MKIYNQNQFIYILFFALIFTNYNTDKRWEGQGPIKKVNSETVPVQQQHKGIFDLGNGIFCSTNFDGNRLNGMALTKNTIVSVLITPENTPINGSPWYAFKIW